MSGFVADQATRPNTRGRCVGQGQGTNEPHQLGKALPITTVERHGNVSPQLVDITDNGGH